MARLVLLHGFTQTTVSWRRPAESLRRLGHDPVALALPGHEFGRDLDESVAGDLWEAATPIGDQGGTGTWIGYSMGARLALHVALSVPESVQRLVLLGGTPGIVDPTERAHRRADDEALAARIEQVGTDQFLDDWLSGPLFADRPVDEVERADRRRNSSAGLAASLRRWGTGTMDPPLWDRLADLTMPTLILAGGDDAKFTTIGRQMVEGIGPMATFGVVPNAGHAAHLEQPDAFASLVDAWLLAHPGS